MRSIGFAGVLLAAGAGLCHAQSQGAAVQCVISAAPAPLARQEGVTELVADLLLTCTGGTPTPPGQTIPQVNIRLTLNTAVTSKLLPNGGSEALLLIDDPLGPSNPQTPQVACTNITAGCPVQGTGGVPNPFTMPGIPNVFEGRQVSPNALEWDRVPIDPPAAGGNRLFRITNVRANANQLGVGATTAPAQIAGFISISGSAGNILVANPQHTVALVQPGLAIATTPVSLQQCPGVNGGNIFNPNPAGHGATFHLLIKEQAQNALKRQNVATSLTDPNAGGVQNVPGQIPPYVESGFIPDPNTGLPPGVGTVDSGSLIQVIVSGLPSGVSIQVPATIPLIAEGSRDGTAITLLAGGGATIGTDVQFTPALSTGSVVFYLDVVETANLTTPPKLLDLPIALIGQAASVPAHISATASFPAAVNPQTTLFAADSPRAPLRPIFQPVSDTGIVAALSPNFAGASVVDCNNTTSTLTASGTATVNFIEGPGTTAPLSYNLGIVSTGPPVPNVVVSTDPPAAWLNVSLNQTTTPATATFSVNLSNAPSNASTNVIFTSSSVAGTLLTVPVTLAATPGPWFIRYGIANLGSYVNDAIAPGEPFVLFGGNEFGPSVLAGAALDSGGLVATLIGNTQVLFDSNPVPLSYVVDANGFGQLAGFAPFALDGKSQTLVQVIYNSVASPVVALPVLDAVPGLFTADQSGGGPGAILNQDGTVNGPANPDAVGNVIALYGGGAGQTTPAGRDGAFAGVVAPLSTLNLPLKVFIDGILAADVPYAGPAPQLEEGLFQINVRIPQGVHAPGDVSVLVQIGDKMTQPGVTVSVK